MDLRLEHANGSSIIFLDSGTLEEVPYPDGAPSILLAQVPVPTG